MRLASRNPRELCERLFLNIVKLQTESHLSISVSSQTRQFPDTFPSILLSRRDEMERMFESKDRDSDGRLSFEEFMGEESRAERLFKLMDKDGDGYVTKNVSGPGPGVWEEFPPETS